MRIPGPIAGRRCRAAVVAAVVACSTAFTGPGPTTADGGPTPSVPAPELDWRPCVQGGPFDCATTEEPLGYRDPGGRTIELAVVRRKATGPGGRVGTLFFNPGGPGGPGTVQMPQNYEFFPQEVRERFDIVSWGPRGVGNSTAVNCFASPEEAAAWNAGRPAGFPVGGKERAAYTAAYKDLVRRCRQRDPELLRHVSTADTARDLDRLRRAVDDPRAHLPGDLLRHVPGRHLRRPLPRQGPRDGPRQRLGPGGMDEPRFRRGAPVHGLTAAGCGPHGGGVLGRS